MSITIDCGEGKHQICSGTGTEAYMFPQDSGDRFLCGCVCHHEGIVIDGELFKGRRCPDC